MRSTFVCSLFLSELSRFFSFAGLTSHGYSMNPGQITVGAELAFIQLSSLTRLDGALSD